jgi:tripartite-type tricarboxylate transporter receptor subunit TctC
MFALAAMFLLPLIVAWPGAAHAQSWPSRPVRLIIPYPAGGSTDILGRILAERITTSIGQQMVVENRAGATGVIGAEMVAKSPADGYTLVMGVNGPITIAPAIRASMPYDTVKDFAPVILVAEAPKLLVISPSIPARTLPEFIAYAKARPNQLSFASAGIGTTGHLASEMLKQMAGIELNHVPYKGGAPAVQDILGGHVQMMFEVMPQLLPHVESGRLRALAITSPKRSSALPNLPTVAEQGLAGFQSSTWFGILAPAATPAPVVDRLNAEFAKALALPDIAKKIVELGAAFVPNTPAEFGAFLRADLEKWRRVVRDSGAKFE